MVTTAIKTTFRKMEPKLIKYRDYKFFCNDTFRESLQNIISQNCDDHYNNFAISCKNIFDKIAPWKRKYVRRNYSPFMNKALSKAIMARTKHFCICLIGFNSFFPFCQCYFLIRNNFIR